MTLAVGVPGRSNLSGPGKNSQLESVAGTSPANAWAVGVYIPKGTAVLQALIEHWNGKSWRRVPGARLGSGTSELDSVAATSAANAWAVGRVFPAATYQTLIEHWNGARWTRLSSPHVGSPSQLSGVAAAGPSDIWAVGFYSYGTVSQTLALHCC